MADSNMELEFIKEYLNFLLKIYNEKNNKDNEAEGLTNSLHPEDISLIQSLFEKLYNSGTNDFDLNEHILNEIRNVRG